MVQRKKVSVAVGLVLFFTAFIFIVALNQSIFAKEQMPKETIKTVILKKDAGITPNPLEVKLGTTIVWFNNDNGPITIKFIDKLGVACKVPVNFYSDLFGYYETRPIPEGGTASICFIYKGDYAYEVKRLVDQVKGEQTEEISTAKIIAVE
jgi:plastocyanin